MGRGQAVDVGTCQFIIHLHCYGTKYRDIERITGISKSTIYNICKKWNTNDQLLPGTAPGQQPALSNHDLRRLLQDVNDHPFKTLTDLTRATSLNVSERTI